MIKPSNLLKAKVVICMMFFVSFAVPQSAYASEVSAFRCFIDPLLFWLRTPKECAEEITPSTPVTPTTYAKPATTYAPPVIIEKTDSVENVTSYIESQVKGGTATFNGITKSELETRLLGFKKEILNLIPQSTVSYIQSPSAPAYLTSNAAQGGYSYNPDGASKKFVQDEIAAVSTLAQQAFDLASSTAANGGGGVATSSWSTNGTALYYTGGNVGVGTNTPLTALEVVNMSSSSMPTSALNSSVVGTFSVSNLDDAATYTGIHLKTRANGAATALVGLAYGTTFADGGLFFRIRSGSSASTEVMRILSNGNLGLGTTSPQAKLHLSFTGSNDGGILINTSISRKARIDLMEGGSNAVFGVLGGGFQIENDGNTDTFNINSALNTTTATRFSIDRTTGNIGVGTTTPAARLHIAPNNGESSSLLLAVSTSSAATSTNLFTVSNSGVVIVNRSGISTQILGSSENQGTMQIFGKTGQQNTFVMHGTGNAHNVLVGYSTPGTADVPTATPVDRGLMRMAGGGYTGSSYTGKGEVGIWSAENWSSTSTGTYIRFETTVNGSTSRTEKVRITDAGYLGIGTTTPSTGLVVATGTIQSTALLGGATTLSTDANGNIIRTPSDQTLKKDITPISGALDKVLQLQGVTYNWIDSSRFGTEREMGLIAQQIEPIVPEVVKSGGTYKSVNYQNLVALLIEAIKDLSNKVEPVLAWFKDGDFVVQKNICVDDVCVSKDRFKQILMDPTIGGGITYTAPVIENPVTETPTSTSTSTPNVEVPAPEISSSTPPTEETVVPEEPITPAPEAPEIMPE